MTGDLPPEFDPAAYRSLSPEFAALDDAALAEHYRREGREAGLPGNLLRQRGSFAALVRPDSLALEIGPFASPLLQGRQVRYCDVLDTQQLRERAASLGLDPSRVPTVHYRIGPGQLDDIPDRFGAVLSSHAIEHQPDLVEHLQQVGRRLEPGGRYFVLVPDKRYCFDRHIAPSTIADVLQAHEEGRRSHTLRSVIEHRALTVHNDPGAHWADGTPWDARTTAIRPEAVTAAIEEYRASAGGYLDVHAWYFTPDSFAQILGLLHQLGLTGLALERLYPTRRGSPEFWAVLRQEAAASASAAAPTGTSRGSLLGRALRSAFRR